MAYTISVYKNNLIIYGGIDEQKLASCDLMVITFGNSVNGLNSKKRHEKLNKHTSEDALESSTLDFECDNCGHIQDKCNLLEIFPEIGFKNLEFCSKVQIPSEIIDQFVNEFFSPVAALLRISEIIGKDTFIIRNNGFGHMRGSEYIKYSAPPIKIDFNFMKCEADKEYEIRQNMIKNYNLRGIDSKVLILSLESSIMLSPGEVANYFSGHSEENLIYPLFRISKIAVIISRTKEYLSVGLIQNKNQHPPFFFVVFDNKGNLIYPFKEAASGNLSNILTRSHLDLELIHSHLTGTKIYVYSPDIKPENNDLMYDSQVLSEILKIAYFKAPFSMIFMINDSVITEENIKGKQVKGAISNELCKYWKIDYDMFSMLIYIGNRLVYWEMKQLTGRRQRDEKLMVIKMADESLVSKITNQLKWDKNMAYLFSDIYEIGMKKRKLDF